MKKDMTNSASRRAVSPFRRACLWLMGIILTLATVGIFVMYGPFSYFRDLWVSTAMTTFSHQWLATMLYDEKTIKSIMAHNIVREPTQNTDPKQVKVDSSVKDNATELPTSPEDGEHIIDGIGFTKLKGLTYNGWLVKIYDPSRLYLSTSQTYGKSGELISHMAKRLDAYIGINAGAFIDQGGHGDGGTADGTFIANGQQLNFGAKGATHNVIGIDKQGRLLLGRYTQSQISTLNLRDAVEFKPFLIVNGVPTEMEGNGGYGIQPRTAIGQTQQGTVIFIIIDGRSAVSQGASVKELQTIMRKNNAYNAANLDGGSSSVLVVNGKLINHPSSPDGERYLPNGFFVRYTPNWTKR